MPRYEGDERWQSAWRWVKAAWLVPGLTPSERLVLLAYADHANAEEAICWPGGKRLQEQTGLSRTTLYRARKRLIDRELVEIISEAGKSRRSATLRLHLWDYLPDHAPRE